ncbi:glutathione S-transferase family protein [Enterovirga rhinocerotis]|uniref:Glutathione S-transferase n=1 Tax=Enterovirga rhinocerotis TaxID=1339210 RepID=A0A4R7C1T9_9HYPH|nr:glutathione S-transferase [Enterovirga rhinocerotis]TDR90497.1 glutathione S-transferase [Enterovirga rhinocerotis]
MKLHHSPSSPFVRKVMVVAHELGLADRIEIVKTTAHPIDRNDAIRVENPLGQVPTLTLADGRALYDSRVICEYLDATAGGALFGTGDARWRAITEQALADGLLGAALLTRYEMTLRSDSGRFDAWIQGQMAKVEDALDRFEAILADAGDRLDIGTITIGCGLGYLDFRFADLGWREGRPAASGWFERFGARPSMVATDPAS